MFYQTSLFIYSAISPLQVLSRKSEGIVLLYNLTIYRKVLFSSPVFCIAKYRGDVRRTERLILIAQKTHEIFSTPLHRNCRFFGLSPILLTQHPVCFVQQGRCPSDGGVNSYSPKTNEIFSISLHRNCRYFGVSPILLTQYPVRLRDTAGKKEKCKSIAFAKIHVYSHRFSTEPI